MILLRDDLARAAHDCGLGFRAGERRYVLKSLLSQDPGGTLSWLAAFAEGWAGRLGEGTPGTVGSFWGGRARATAGLLGELAAEPAGWAPLAGETS